MGEKTMSVLSNVSAFIKIPKVYALFQSCTLFYIKFELWLSQKETTYFWHVETEIFGHHGF